MPRHEILLKEPDNGDAMPYPSDVTDEQWQEIESFFDPPHPGRPRILDGSTFTDVWPKIWSTILNPLKR